MKCRVLNVGVFCLALSALYGCDDPVKVFTVVVTATPRDTPTAGPTAPPTATASATPTGDQPVVTPTVTSTPSGDPICGNGTIESGEDCDDGNNFGGDGCAANCTFETRRQGTFTEASQANVRSVAIPIALPLRGTTAMTTGRPRDTVVVNPAGDVITLPGQVPVAFKAVDVRFEPISLFGLLCACVRAVPHEAFGPGNSGAGLIGCSDAGLTDVDYLLEQDHNTTPGSPGNSGSASGLPDDPECSATSSQGEGIVSSACLEGSGPTCSEPNFEHLGICNSPRVITRSGGPAGRGSMFILNNTAIGTLADNGTCATVTPDCRWAEYGPDCLACTDDDLDLGVANLQPTTSGTANTILYDTNNNAGVMLSPAQSVTGENANCDLLDEPGGLPLLGTLVAAFPGIDTPDLGDTATTSILQSR
jgi:cysteine-rich repeat protein